MEGSMAYYVYCLMVVIVTAASVVFGVLLFIHGLALLVEDRGLSFFSED